MKATHYTDVLIVIGSLNTGGTEKHLLQILPRLKKRGFKIAIATFSQPGTLAPLFEQHELSVFSPNLPSWTEKVTPIKLLLKVLWLGKILSSLRPAAVHSFLPEAYLIGNLWALLLKIPVRIMSRRSLIRYQTKHPLLTRLEHWLHGKTHILIGNSNAVVEELKKESGRNAQRVRLINNGVDTSVFSQTKSRKLVRSSLGIPEEALLITKVANYIPYKGHADLLSALHLISAKLPKNWRLACVGRDDGPLKTLQNRTKQVGLVENILWLGSRNDIPDILCASDIGVLNSHEEGSSNAILECMAAGLPMIATNVGGNPELLENGVTGILVSPIDCDDLADALLHLASDPHRRASMGAAGKSRVAKKFSLETCVQSYQQLYSSLKKDVP